MRRLLLLVCLLIIPTSTPAQGRIPVRVNHSGSDKVGIRLSYELKEALASSARYTVTDDPTSAVISLVSLGIRSDKRSDADEALSSGVSVQFHVSWQCANGSVNEETTHSVHVLGVSQARPLSRDILSSYAEWLDKSGPVACPVLDNNKRVFRPGKLIGVN